LFLNRETFFESNRTFLSIGLVTAFVLPLIIIPKYIEVEPTVMEGAFAYGNTISQPIADNSISFISVLTYVYLAGVFFFFGRFIFQFGSLVLLFIKSTKQRVAPYIYVLTKNTLSPFSFFNWIVFNPDHFSKTELEQIITHEKVHAQQLHSIDILLVELTSIVLWFNPFVWLYKKDLRQNLEFIADKNAQATTNCKKSYQHLLLKTSAPNYQMALTNNFYNSLIKKRIVMLHKNRSNNRNQLKFLLILPALVVFLMSFNTKEVYVDKEPIHKSTRTILDLNAFDTLAAEADIESTLPKTEKKATSITNQQTSKAVSKQDIATYFIESTFTDAQLDNVVTKIKAQGVTLKIKGVKRNSDNEITALKIDAKSDKSNANFSIDNDSAIKTISISYNAKDNSISIGNTNSLIHDKDYEYTNEDGVITIEKSGKKNNVFVYSSDENHNSKHIIRADSIRFNGNIHVKNKNIISTDSTRFNGNIRVKDENVIVISESTVIELKGNVTKDGKALHEWKDKGRKSLYGTMDKDGNVFIHSNGGEKDKLLIDKDSKGKVIIKSSENGTLWNGDTDSNFTVTSLGKGENKIFISGGNSGNNKALFIVDDKEVAKKDLDVEPNNIESVNVLKGEAAIKLYGDKGKDGVIVITTKKKKD